MRLSRESKLGRHLLVVEMRIDGKEGNWFKVGWHNMCGELHANGSSKCLAPRPGVTFGKLTFSATGVSRNLTSLYHFREGSIWKTSWVSRRLLLLEF